MVEVGVQGFFVSWLCIFLDERFDFVGEVASKALVFGSHIVVVVFAFVFTCLKRSFCGVLCIFRKDRGICWVRVV